MFSSELRRLLEVRKIIEEGEDKIRSRPTHKILFCALIAQFKIAQTSRIMFGSLQSNEKQENNAKWAVYHARAAFNPVSADYEFALFNSL